MLKSLRDQVRGVVGRLVGRRGGGCASQAIEILDLLGRKPVNLDTPELQRFLANKRVLVTGAGGSIGSEICRQTIRFCPQKLILLDQAENNLFEIDRELRHRWVGADIRPYIADITDATRIKQVFEAEQPQVVFHAAAHKHVPMMELNPGEAIKNNVFGTKTVADAALAAGVQAFVMISTDKAVNPTSVMGATKRCAELYIQSLNTRHEGIEALRHEVGMKGSGVRGQGSALAGHLPLGPVAGRTRFVAVRFGNVLGSSGSVIPIFKKQIEAGGPVTVTHPEMQRYFMTIPEASQLVMQAGAIGQGGEIFILDMGRPIKILDLAREMIERSGLRVDEDIQIQFTGMRPGEKLFEELACDYEEAKETSDSRIRIWELPAASAGQVKRMLDLLHSSINADREQVLFALRQSVPEYRPTEASAATAPSGVVAEAA